jgi:pyruvate dehydrogenase E1 component
MAIVRIMNMMLKDKNDRQERRAHRAGRVAHLRHGRHVPPVGIWNQQGQNYVPEDHDQLMFYKESKTGQVLQEGINEAGAMSDWIAAARPTRCITCR